MIIRHAALGSRAGRHGAGHPPGRPSRRRSPATTTDTDASGSSGSSGSGSSSGSSDADGGSDLDGCDVDCGDCWCRRH